MEQIQKKKTGGNIIVWFSQVLKVTEARKPVFKSVFISSRNPYLFHLSLDQAPFALIHPDHFRSVTTFRDKHHALAMTDTSPNHLDQ